MRVCYLLERGVPRAELPGPADSAERAAGQEGDAEGSVRFERFALAEQLRFAIRGLAALGAEKVQIALTPLSETGERVTAAMIAELGQEAGEIVVDCERRAGRGYYRDLCLKGERVRSRRAGEIGDGGFTDWTAGLIASKKERLLISGLGMDRLATMR